MLLDIKSVLYALFNVASFIQQLTGAQWTKSRQEVRLK